MTWTLGASTKSTILKSESHKLFQEFEVSGTIHKGQPVLLEPATGKVIASPGTAADKDDIIGISIHEGNSIYGETVVVMMKAFAIVACKLGADLTAGKVQYAGYDVSDAYPGNQKEFAGYNLIEQAANTTQMWGWALQPGVTDDIVEVAVSV